MRSAAACFQLCFHALAHIVRRGQPLADGAHIDVFVLLHNPLDMEAQISAALLIEPGDKLRVGGHHHLGISVFHAVQIGAQLLHHWVGQQPAEYSQHPQANIQLT